MSQAANSQHINPGRALRLLPIPKEITLHEGVCRLNRGSVLQVQAHDPRVERAALGWLRSGGDSENSGPSECEQPTTVRMAVDAEQVTHSNGYRLRICEDGIELVGESPAGCFHGIQTLVQLGIADCGLGIAAPEVPTDFRRSIDSGFVRGVNRSRALPCCTILDWPDFSTRGLLHDITRGKVPTLETLKQIVDRVSFLKINQLQLYIEHAFVFSFDPEICSPDEGLTPDEVRELDLYCRQRFIDLIPALATFGHMGHVLSMPRYRHLAEIEATKTWADMTWPQRMRGLTLDCMNPEAHKLVERMWSDVLDAFSAPIVNICGDEPWDLGHGKNKGRFDDAAKGKAYVEQLHRTHDICATRGRKTQFFSDVLRNHPELLNRLPPGSTVLHWGYDGRADYDGTGAFVAAGLPTFVCPGTSGWKRILNAMELAERNIRDFADAGFRHSATGLVNTDWGDHGHFNSLACSWHSVALGAALGWAADHPVGAVFDECAAPLAFGMQDAWGLSLLRKASRIAERCETWRLLWMPMHAVSADTTLPSDEEADEAREHASEFLDWLDRVKATDHGDPRDLAELSVAARFTELFAEKIALVHKAGNSANRVSFAPSACHDLAEKVDRAADAYAECWRARNKKTGLDDILRALSTIAEDLRAFK